MSYWFLPVSILTWVLYITLVTPLWLLGLPLVAVAAALKAYDFRVSSKWPGYPPMLQWRWRWMYIYGNEEDGVDGSRGYMRDPTGYWTWLQERWLSKTSKWSMWRRVFVWSALRNPMGNLRFVKGFSLMINPKKVRGATYFYSWGDVYLARQGLYSGMKVLTMSEKQFRIGWNILPWDRAGIPDGDYRAKGCGFKLLIRDGARLK